MFCDREEDAQGKVEEEMEVPEVDEEEDRAVEVDMEDEGLEMEIMEVLEHCSSSRIILSSTSP